MTVTGDRRTILFASNVSGTANRYPLLYRWLDAAAIRVGRRLTRNHYGRVSTLTGGWLTSAAFVTRIRILAGAPGCAALDVVLNVHGRPDALRFADDWTEVARLGEQIEELDLGHRLRLLYSTCCYGNDHAPAFVAAGFRTASGAVAVNTNGTFDFPTQLRRWTAGDEYHRVVRAANNRRILKTHDRLAALAGFDDVDSFKILHGDARLTIDSEAA